MLKLLTYYRRMVTIGEKIRYFRNRRGLTQFELELELNTSYGTVSRVESGKVNPTKETILRISQVLGVSSKELSYMIGDLIQIADDNEIAQARKVVADHFSKSTVLAYLVDDRARLIDVSAGFVKFLRETAETKAKVLGQSVVTLAIDHNFGIRKYFDEIVYEEFLHNLLKKFHSEVGFMQLEKEYQDTISIINKDNLAKSLWEKVINSENLTIRTIEHRTVTFRVLGLSFSLTYSSEPLPQNKRFELVEYIPTNKVLRFLSQIF